MRTTTASNAPRKRSPRASAALHHRRHFSLKKKHDPALFCFFPSFFSPGRPQQPRAPRAGASSSSGHGIQRPGGSPLHQRLRRRIKGQAPRRRPQGRGSLSSPLGVWRPPAGARLPLARQAQAPGPRQGQGGTKQPDRRRQVWEQRRDRRGASCRRSDLSKQPRRLRRRRPAGTTSGSRSSRSAGRRPLGLHGQARPPLR